MKYPRLMAILALTTGLLAACGDRAKQEAALKLEAAKLSVADMRKEGAEAFAPATAMKATAKLTEAQNLFKKKKFDDAKAAAQAASAASVQALEEAKKNKSSKKSSAKRRTQKSK